MTKKALAEFRNYLNSVQPGPLADASPVKQLLPECWDDFEGNDTGGMAPHKLDRIEDLQWDPPELSFIIERHGAMVEGGSSRTEIQSWTVNLDTLTAMASICGFRQKTPAQPRLDIAPLVERVVHGLERADRNEESIKRVSDTRIRVQVGVLIPAEVPKQTVAGRRKRFRRELKQRLADIGWHPVEGTAPYTYEKSDARKRSAARS